MKKYDGLRTAYSRMIHAFKKIEGEYKTVSLKLIEDFCKLFKGAIPVSNTLNSLSIIYNEEVLDTHGRKLLNNKEKTLVLQESFNIFKMLENPTKVLESIIYKQTKHWYVPFLHMYFLNKDMLLDYLVEHPELARLKSEPELEYISESDEITDSNEMIEKVKSIQDNIKKDLEQDRIKQHIMNNIFQHIIIKDR